MTTAGRGASAPIEGPASAGPGQRATTITRAEVDGAVVDVRLEGDRVVAVEADLPFRGTAVVDAGGAALLPGLWDHHLHLLALAAARTSVDLGGVADAAGADRALRTAAGGPDRRPGAWLRVVGWDDRHGAPTPARLDRAVPERPVRVQHRSGAAWALSSSGLAAVGRSIDDLDGAGWLHRVDDALAARWRDGCPPPLAPVGSRLAAVGVTGATDATPSTDLGAFDLLADARAAGELPQRVVVTGGPALAEQVPPEGLGRGPVKVVVTDHDLPSVDDLAAALARAHAAGRPAAVHCVTRVALVLALAAWEAAGAMAGDRIEHASVLPVELVPAVAALGLTVVTQPGFVRARGDAYLAEVDADDVPHLYRCGSLPAAGIPVGGSTDAPFGPDDPWLAIAAAVDRRTDGGQVLGGDEAMPAAGALALFLTAPDDPGGTLRRVTPGAPADLCLLDRPLAAALADPSSDHVRATWIAGQPTR